MIAFHESLEVTPLSPLSDYARQLHQQGRLLLASLKLSEGKWCLIANCYCQAGHDQKHVREETHVALAQEMLMHGACDKVLLGDFNAPLISSAVGGMLLPRGWHLPHPVNVQGDPSWTYLSGASASNLDGIALSPDFLQNVPIALTSRIGQLPHAMLSLPMQACHMDRGIPVRHPPRMRPCSRMHATPVDWDAFDSLLNGRAEQLVVEASSHSYSYPQGQIDYLWECWTANLRRELIALAIPEEGSIERSVQMNGLSWHRRPPQEATVSDRGTRLREEVRLYKAWHRLVAHQQEPNPKCLQRLRQEEDFICHSLDLTHGEFQAHLRDPLPAIDLWLEKIRHVALLRRERSIRKWRAELITQTGRPSRALFRWLRGGMWGGHFVTTTHEGLARGRLPFFAALRAFWGKILTDEPLFRDRTKEAITQHYLKAPEWDSDWPHHDEKIEALLDCARHFKVFTSSGMDGWSPSVVTCLSPQAARSLYEVFCFCQRFGVWPSALYDVRMQMIPKTCGAAPPPLDFDPSVSSLSGTDYGPIGPCAAWEGTSGGNCLITSVEESQAEMLETWFSISC